MLYVSAYDGSAVDSDGEVFPRPGLWVATNSEGDIISVVDVPHRAEHEVCPIPEDIARLASMLTDCGKDDGAAVCEWLVRVTATIKKECSNANTT